VMKANRLNELTDDTSLKSAIANWEETLEDTLKSKVATDVLVEALEKASLSGEADTLRKDLLRRKDMLSKKSYWSFGGDGWAYDIGFSGLDHVISTGENVNMFVMDTEIYSNTGGQASKATPTGSIAKFAAAGKNTGKKDLGMISMSYGNVYVAQIGMGANQAQTLKAIMEAEAFPGPSVVIAYAPCVSHGIKGGMQVMQEQTKRAVAAGYWHLYRFNPLLEAKGENPFILDSKEPTASFEEFLDSESRYEALKRDFPERAERLYKIAEEQAIRRYKEYKRLADHKL